MCAVIFSGVSVIDVYSALFNQARLNAKGPLKAGLFRCVA